MTSLEHYQEAARLLELAAREAFVVEVLDIPAGKGPAEAIRRQALHPHVPAAQVHALLASAAVPACPRPAGAWLCYYSDWSGIAVFGDELDAHRYSAERGGGMTVVFTTWGEVR